MGFLVMGLGMQVFDAAGNIMIDVTTRLSRVIGTAGIPAGSTSSLTVPNAQQGTIWYAIYGNGGNRYSPIITVSGNVISWSPRGGFPGGAVDVTMLYGLY